MTKTNGNGFSGWEKNPPPLPLIPEMDPNQDEQMLSFKLYSNPTDTTSTKLTFAVRMLNGSENCRSAIQFWRDVQKLFIGMNVTDGLPQYQLVRQLLKGQALTTFESSLRTLVELEWNILREAARENDRNTNAATTDQTVEAAAAAVAEPVPNPNWIGASVYRVIAYMAPHKALAKQKRYLRRQIRKPKDMKTRVFVNHLVRINTLEIPFLPPKFNSTQSLPEDEVTDLLSNAIPRKWIKEMDRMDFDPAEKTLQQVVAFCERMEATEEHEEAADKKVVEHKGGKKDDKSHKKVKTTSGDNKSRNCVYHGPNTHPTSECKVVKAMVDSAKKGSSSSKPSFDKSKNKTWMRKADEAKTSTKKELAAYVKKAVRKEVNSISKKRPAKDDDDEKSLNAIDLSGFNYEDMDNLKIESDDDTVEEGEVDDVSV